MTLAQLNNMPRFAWPQSAGRTAKIMLAAVAAATTIISAQPAMSQSTTGQTAASTCDTGSFMVGDVNAAIQNRFGDVPFIAGPLCSVMDKMVLVTVIVGFGILVWAGVDSHSHKKGFSSAISPFFDIIIGFILAWLLIGFYSVNSGTTNNGAPITVGG